MVVHAQGRSARLAGVGLAALAGLFAASCGTQAATAGSGSGSGTTAATAVVSGSVVAGPGCPVERASRRCPSRPVAGVLVEALRGGLTVPAGSGEVAARARTGHDGSFVLDVTAGTYRLEVRTAGPYPRCPPVTVSVAAGARRHLVVTCDTGIR